ncbi:hypothetical protein HS7_03690 [Sulfolobales archaeon HS-7]|nr:hypothetical protein HS7_03690 [Sulfolobales archaeon HS-7]
MQPFYFKSYDRIVSEVHDVNELKEKLEEIGKSDPACVNWHLSQGHISAWLHYIGEHGLAEVLRNVNDYREAVSRINEFETIGKKIRQKQSSRRSKSKR